MKYQCSKCGEETFEEDIRIVFPFGIEEPGESKCDCGAVDSFEPLNEENEICN